MYFMFVLCVDVCGVVCVAECCLLLCSVVGVWGVLS